MHSIQKYCEFFQITILIQHQASCIVLNSKQKVLFILVWQIWIEPMPLGFQCQHISQLETQTWHYYKFMVCLFVIFISLCLYCHPATRLSICPSVVHSGSIENIDGQLLDREPGIMCIMCYVGISFRQLGIPMKKQKQVSHSDMYM